MGWISWRLADDDCSDPLPEIAPTLHRRSEHSLRFVDRDRRGDVRRGRGGFSGIRWSGRERRRGGDRGLGAAAADAGRRDRPAGHGRVRGPRLRHQARAVVSWRPSRSSVRPTRTGPNTAAPSSPSAPPCSGTKSASRSSTSSRPAHPTCIATSWISSIRPIPPWLTTPLPSMPSPVAGREKRDTWLLETWPHPLALGRPLPTLPLWLADNDAVPLELEPSYEETCRILRIP